MGFLLIATPTEFEASGVRRAIRRLPNGKREQIRLVICGVGGDAFVANLTSIAAEFSPSHVLVAGFCGALREEIRVGDAFFYFKEKNNENDINIFYSSNLIAIKTFQKVKIAEQNPAALVVDMETRPAVSWCEQAGIPCSVIRVISDSFFQDLPLTANLLLALANRQPGAGFRLTAYLVRNFREIPGFFRFIRSSFHGRSALSAECFRWIEEVLSRATPTA